MAKTWACPFYRWDAKQKLRCEAGGPAFACRDTYRAYTNAYCADAVNWKKCSLAAYLVRQYEEENNDAKRG